MINKFRRIVKRIFKRTSKLEFEKIKQIEKEFPTVLSTKDTLNIIIKHKASICRFGDGEFDICNQENKDDPYQKPSDELTNRLKEILSTESNNKRVVCIPPFNSKYNNIKDYYGRLTFWQWYWLNKYEKISPNLNSKYYGNSFVSRDEVFYENQLNEIKSIWGDRKVVFVYGKNGRFNEDSILFDNIKEKQRIFVLPTNAFDNYETVYNECKNYGNEYLFIIAAGPMATVLAYDLSEIGYQALDLGHLPNCYDQYLGNINSPESLPLIKGKNENED